MATGSVEPWTDVLRLDESSTLRAHRYAAPFTASSARRQASGVGIK
jgi:hypothetical protein